MCARRFVALAVSLDALPVERESVNIIKDGKDKAYLDLAPATFRARNKSPVLTLQLFGSTMRGRRFGTRTGGHLRGGKVLLDGVRVQEKS